MSLPRFSLRRTFLRRSAEMKRRPWTTTEVAYLREHRDEGLAALAARLDRSTAAIRCGASRFRVSLRSPGSRRGSILGQPRGISLAKTVRDSLTDGTIDATVIAERMKLDENERLCPACARRPVRVPSSGFCRVCHNERLTAAHLESLAEIESQRVLWAARQQVSRSHRAAVAEGAIS